MTKMKKQFIFLLYWQGKEMNLSILLASEGIVAKKNNYFSKLGKIEY